MSEAVIVFCVYCRRFTLCSSAYADICCWNVSTVSMTLVSDVFQMTCMAWEVPYWRGLNDSLSSGLWGLWYKYDMMRCLCFLLTVLVHSRLS